MVSTTRPISCLTLVSRRGVPSWPRKYLLTTTLVAICDQALGISTSFCSKTTAPFSLVMVAVRRSHSTSSKGWTPGRVNLRSTLRPEPVVDEVAEDEMLRLLDTKKPPERTTYLNAIGLPVSPDVPPGMPLLASSVESFRIVHRLPAKVNI